MKIHAASLALAASVAPGLVQAAVLGRYELAQPLIDENAIASGNLPLKFLREREVALEDSSMGSQDRTSGVRLMPHQIKGIPLSSKSAPAGPFKRAAALLGPSRFERRIVGSIACNGFSKSGTLQFVSTGAGSVHNAALQGVRNERGLQMLDIGIADTEAPAQTFTFNACNSSFMDEHPQVDDGATEYYGHLQWDQSTRHCLAASKLAEPTTRLVNDLCSTSDDSSQMLQYWKLVRRPSSNGGGEEFELVFMGRPRQDPDGDFKNKYTLGRETPDNNGQGRHFVKLNRVDEAAGPSGFYLRLA